jgi:hypothetical protein
MTPRLRKNLKWILILMAFILFTVFFVTGNVFVLFINSSLFWLYVIADKMKNLKKANINKLYKNEKDKKIIL